MAWVAEHRYARIAPRKARLIADMVRGLDVQDALNVLKFTPNRAAPMISKVVTSAVANANEAEADVDLLVIVEIRIDEGPTMKRFRPKDRGRAHGILKRTSHISVAVEEEE
ncbi:MAG: 50S ribosomal protein L22 [Planctomycetes bacterium]|nr:50S ribosomal protein L22 [Phycisphaerae bacterium]NBB96069.1 50S ribosomal protein L22 [Planctomycetota bacterium]